MSRARVIPSIDHLLSLPPVRVLAAAHGALALRGALEAEVASMRDTLCREAADVLPARADVTAHLVRGTAERLTSRARAVLQPVINATGVIIHTNLGRAPLSEEALAAVQAVAGGYANLEIDLASGQRGSRHVHAERLLMEVTGAAAAVVANNTAAALTLALSALATGREVIISRGELVEIGGGFRVPEILRASGALLREVGTTNRTRPADYAAAISDRTAAILRVHPSNFRIEGFTERPVIGALVELGRRFGVPVIEDQGSGWLGRDLFPTGAFPVEARALLAEEPAVRDSVRDGADLVGFSGDKLLGGPQCGVLVGRADLIATIRQHPLMRAMRVDKLTYAALEATLQAFAGGRAASAIPVLRMIALPAAAVHERAAQLRSHLQHRLVECSLVPGVSTIGGGSLPGSALPTTLVSLNSPSADARLARLRHGTPPIIARIIGDRVCLDLRTVPSDMDDVVAAAVFATAEP